MAMLRISCLSDRPPCSGSHRPFLSSILSSFRVSFGPKSAYLSREGRPVLFHQESEIFAAVVDGARGRWRRPLFGRRKKKNGPVTIHRWTKGYIQYKQNANEQLPVPDISFLLPQLSTYTCKPRIVGRTKSCL
ncbi:hypothetical protein OPV22_024999 [Ensete ventricosum]|uniref:Uncharacterized protein n=1 Tax=Ensete ventricosum TaxID=4639 RepID=A0AAV8P708_ENSVE|nr:hypothetical protein OPV22_024999 [Ensete ventricosum]